MWKTVKLGDIAKAVGGNGFPKKYQGDTDKDIPFFKVSDMNAGGNEKFMFSSNNYVDANDLREMKAKHHPAGTIIFPKIGGAILTNKKRILTKDAAFDNNVMGVVTTDKVFPEYLYKVFLNLNLYELSNKAALPSITNGTVDDIEFQLPPLAEQQRIVAKLDAAFAEIDTAIAAAEKNAENAEAIYAYAINAMFAEHSDKAVKIGDYAKINYGYTAKASHDNGEYKFLRITDIQDGTVNWQSVPYCDVESKKISSVLLKDGDIVFARTGATTGKSFLVRNPINAVFASYLIRVSLDKEAFLPDFVLHYFQSEEYWRQVDEGTSGAAQGGFNASKLNQLMLPLISIDEQINLTEYLNKISQQSSSLKEMYLSKAKKLDTLKSSLLAAELNNMSEAA
jgi:type I restriction enzyme S subunit